MNEAVRFKLARPISRHQHSWCWELWEHHPTGLLVMLGDSRSDIDNIWKGRTPAGPPTQPCWVGSPAAALSITLTSLRMFSNHSMITELKPIGMWPGLHHAVMTYNQGKIAGHGLPTTDFVTQSSNRMGSSNESPGTAMLTRQELERVQQDIMQHHPELAARKLAGLQEEEEPTTSDEVREAVRRCQICAIQLRSEEYRQPENTQETP